MPNPEVPLITEHPDVPAVSESVQQTMGVQPVPTNVTPVNDDQGNPITQTPAQSAKIQIPGDKKTFISWSKGSVTNAATWLGKFFLRLLKIQNANNN